MKVFFVIPSLERGGAEGQLVLLANALAARGHEVGVVSLASGGALAARLKNVLLFALGKTSWAGLPGALAALVGLLRRERPNILHGYLPTANVLAAAACAFAPGTVPVFGLRVSNMDLGALGPAGRLLYRLERRLSPRARLIIANSRAGLEHAAAVGFPRDRLAVVPNAVDPALKPDREAAARLRGEWGAEPGQRLVGVVARLDPMKDQLCFVEAAARLTRERGGLRFVLVGGGLPEYAELVRARIAALGLGDRFVLTGKREDMPAVYAALDLLCQSSAHGEGFPNAVAEALACGTPCVVTDVGDAGALARAAGPAGLVAPPENPAELAAGLAVMLERAAEDPAGLAEAARAAVAQYTPETLAERTEALFAGSCA